MICAASRYLYRRFLLAKAMKTSQSPDNLRTIDPDDPSPGKTVGKDPQRLFIPVTTKSRHDHRFIGNIEISIRGGQALVLLNDSCRHWQLDNIYLFAVQYTHFFQIRPILPDPCI